MGHGGVVGVPTYVRWMRNVGVAGGVVGVDLLIYGWMAGLVAGWMDKMDESMDRWTQQAKGFELQFELAERSGLPVFFHSRACREDFSDMVRRNRDRFSGGVVHSFTGTKEEAEELVSMGASVLRLGGGCCRVLSRMV